MSTVRVMETNNTVRVLSNVGLEGTAATLTVGTVTTGAAGTDAAVSNSGTTSEAVLDFTFPRGVNGADGGTARNFETKADYTADAILSYTIDGDKVVVSIGEDVSINGFPYKVVASGEATSEGENANGVKLQAVPTPAGWYRMEQFDVSSSNTGAQNVTALTAMHAAMGSRGLSKEAHYHDHGGNTLLASTVTMSTSDLLLYSGKGVVWKQEDGDTSAIILSGANSKMWNFNWVEDVPDPHDGTFDGGGIDHATVWVTASGCEIYGGSFTGVTYMAIGTDDVGIRVVDVEIDGLSDSRDATNTSDGTRTGTDTPISVNLPGAVWVDVGTNSKSFFSDLVVRRVIEGVQVGNYSGGTNGGTILTDSFFTDIGDHAIYTNAAHGDGITSVSNIVCTDCRFAIAASDKVSIIGNTILASGSDANLIINEAGIQVRDPSKAICAHNVVEGVSAAISIDAVTSGFSGHVHDVLVRSNIITQTAESIRTGSPNNSIRVSNGNIASSSTPFGLIRIIDNDIDGGNDYEEANGADTAINMVNNIEGVIDIRGVTNSSVLYEITTVIIERNRVINRGATASVYVSDANDVRCRNNDFSRSYAPSSAYTGYEVYFKDVDGLLLSGNFYTSLIDAPNLTMRAIQTDTCTGMCCDEKMDYSTKTLAANSYYSMSSNMNKNRIICNIRQAMSGTFTIDSGGASSGAMSNDNFRSDSDVVLSAKDSNSSGLFKDNGPYAILANGSLNVGIGGTAAATSVGTWGIL